MLRKLFLLVLLLVLPAVFAVGCKPSEIPYNSKSDPNGSRDTAIQLLVNTDRIDNIDAPIGNNESWFYFLPQESGIITVSVFFDTPAGLEASVTIFDGFGRSLYIQTTNPNQNIYEFQPFDVKPERHFIAVKATKGKSIFTLRAGFALPPPPVIEIVPDEPEEEITTGGKTPRCIPADKCKPGQRCCKPTTVAPPPDDGGIAPSEKTIRGTIVLVTPRDGKSDVKISGIGQKNGVKPGAKAYLRGLKLRVDIYSCQQTFCQAMIKATPEDLVRYDTVDVVVE